MATRLAADIILNTEEVAEVVGPQQVEVPYLVLVVAQVAMG